jgi:hypothetical protein
MRCLLLYYSLTGEAAKAVDLVAETARGAGWEPVTCRIAFADPAIAPHRPFRIADTKAWVKAATDGVTMPMRYEPADALDRPYDLVLLFTNTWNHHPSVPVNSFLNSPAAAKLLGGRPFGIYVVCRRSWEKNAEIVRRLGEAAGGRCLGVEHFPHWGGQIGSMIQTVTYIHRSDDGLRSLLGIPLPRYGLSQKSRDKLPVFTRELLAKAAGAQERARP